MIYPASLSQSKRIGSPSRFPVSPVGGAVALWTPAQPTTDGGVLPHTWLVPGVANFQDSAKTTPAGVGDPVGAAVNQGSSSYDVVQATDARRPTLQQVTVDSVTSYVWRYDGTLKFLRGAFGGGALSQPFDISATGKLDAAAVDDNLAHYLVDSNTGQRLLLRKNPIGAAADDFRIHFGADVVGGAANGNWNIWLARASGATSQFWLNGVLVGSGNAGTGNAPGITIGASLGDNVPWFGDISQILIYDPTLSTADKNQVGEYLAAAIGITWTTIT